MEHFKHAVEGDKTGNIHQPIGHHESGIGLIPLGDRDRCKFEYGVEIVEDRDSDPNVRRI